MTDVDANPSLAEIDAAICRGVLNRLVMWHSMQGKAVPASEVINLGDIIAEANQAILGLNAEAVRAKLEASNG